MARIWNIRLNLDDFNSALAGLDSDTERLAFLSGFNAGLNGRLKKDVGGPWESGWEVGNTSHVEAIKFSEQQRAKALLRDYHGNATASPRHESGNAMDGRSSIAGNVVCQVERSGVVIVVDIHLVEVG